MKFKDERIAVAVELTYEDAKKAESIAYRDARTTRILSGLGLLVTLSLTVLCAVSCAQGEIDSGNGVISYSFLSLLLGTILFTNSVRIKDSSDDKDRTFIETAAFARNGVFLANSSVQEWVPYENIRKCIEISDILYLRCKTSHGAQAISCIPARFLSHEDADKIMSLLKARLGRRYKQYYKLCAADNPIRISMPKWANPGADELGKKLCELEYTLTADEAERISRIMNEHQRSALARSKRSGVVIALLMLAISAGTAVLGMPQATPVGFALVAAFSLFTAAVALCSDSIYRRKHRKDALHRLSSDMRYGSRFVLYEHRALVRIGGDEHLICYSPVVNISESDGFTLIDLPQVHFGWFSAIPNRVLSERTEFTQTLSQQLDCQRRKLRAVTGSTHPLGTFDGHGQCILSASCGGIDVSLVRRFGTFMLVCDGKVYAKKKRTSPPVHLYAKVDGIRFYAVIEHNKTARIIADSIEIARTQPHINL